MRGTSPLQWDGGDVVAKCGVVHLVDEDTEESGSFIASVGLELGVDLDDKGRSNGGE